MGHLNMHKPLGKSQLSKSDMGALERNNLTRPRLVRRPHTARHGMPDRTMPQGRKQKIGHPNVNKAPRRSQLSKTDTSALDRNGPT